MTPHPVPGQASSGSTIAPTTPRVAGGAHIGFDVCRRLTATPSPRCSGHTSKSPNPRALKTSNCTKMVQRGGAPSDRPRTDRAHTLALANPTPPPIPSPIRTRPRVASFAPKLCRCSSFPVCIAYPVNAIGLSGGVPGGGGSRKCRLQQRLSVLDRPRSDPGSRPRFP
jgi:hypothetical protein